MTDTNGNGLARRMLEKAFWVMVPAIIGASFLVGGLALRKAYANETAAAVTTARYAEILRRLDVIEAKLDAQNRNR